MTTVNPMQTVTDTLVNVANDAITYADTFRTVESDAATLIAAMTVITRTLADEEGIATVTSYLKVAVDSLDKESAAKARNSAVAAHTAARNFAESQGTSTKGLKALSGKTDERGNVAARSKMPRGTFYTIDDNRFDSLADLAVSLDRSSAYVREYALDAYTEGDTEFSFTIDGTEVVATVAK